MANPANLKLSRLRYFEVSSSLARRLLSQYYQPGNVYTIPFGPMRGMQLIYDGLMTYHELLGLYDRKNFDILSRVIEASGILRPGMVVADIGANVGIYSMWFSRLLQQIGGGKVISFEPNPEVAATLRAHAKLNALSEIEVVEMGLSDRDGTTQFFVGEHHTKSSLLGAERAKRISIRTTTLDSYFLDGECRLPDIIKMDIEGAAEFALTGCDRLLESKRPLWLIESHSPGEDRAISRLLTKFGYEAFRLSDLRWVERKDSIERPDGVWGNHILVPSEIRAKLNL